MDDKQRRLKAFRQRGEVIDLTKVTPPYAAPAQATFCFSDHCNTITKEAEVGDQAISWLMFFTLASGIVIASVAFLAFLRSHRNREIAEATLVGAGPRARRHDIGALPELVGLVVFALIVMSLLFVGYYKRDGQRIADDSNLTRLVV